MVRYPFPIDLMAGKWELEADPQYTVGEYYRWGSVDLDFCVSRLDRVPGVSFFTFENIPDELAVIPVPGSSAPFNDLHRDEQMMHAQLSSNIPKKGEKEGGEEESL